MDIDLSKSIEQLEGDYWEDTSFPTGLVERCTRYRKMPIEDLNHEQLITLIRQQIGLPYLVPVALHLLQQNPIVEAYLYEGDVLESVLNVDTSFWQQHIAIKLSVQQILLNNIHVLSHNDLSIEFRQLSKKLDVHLPIMSIAELIAAIKEKHTGSGIVVYPPAQDAEIREWEKRTGLNLPQDFKELYSICNGFECTEDIFNLIPIREVEKYDLPDRLYYFDFAEYMIRSDIWYVRKQSNDSKYEILNSEFDVVLTDSLQEFLERFLRGEVFEIMGLYDWQEEIKRTT